MSGGDQSAGSRPVRRWPGGAALRVFRYRAFALLWVASFISNIGSWMQTVAVGALVISDTRSATWAVLVAAGGFLPIGVLSPVGGAMADRLPRKPVIIAGELVAAATAAVIALLVAAGPASPGLLVLLVTVQGSASALIMPFTQAILPDLVPRSEFLGAISLNSAQWNLGRIVGPALAGGMVAVLGYPAAFVANAVSFLAIVAVLPFIALSRPGGAQGGLLRSLSVGARVVAGSPPCRSAIGAIAVVAFIASPFIALVPVMARHLTSGGSKEVAQVTGLLTTAQGAGAVLGALALAPLAARFGRGRVLLWSLVWFPVTLVGYATSRTPWWGAATLFAVGLAYIGVLSGLSTVVQLNAPAEYRGRVLSLFSVALGVSYPLGSMLQGPIIGAIGIGWDTAGTAALLLVIMIGVAAIRPGVPAALSGQAEPGQAESGGPGPLAEGSAA